MNELNRQFSNDFFCFPSSYFDAIMIYIDRSTLFVMFTSYQCFCEAFHYISIRLVIFDLLCLVSLYETHRMNIPKKPKSISMKKKIQNTHEKNVNAKIILGLNSNTEKIKC